MKTFLKPLTILEEKTFLEQFRRGEQEAKRVLIERNMRLVAHIVKKYSQTDYEMEDLISIGTIGLIKAVDTFNPDRASRLGTYAAKCIDNEILMFLRAERKRGREVSLYEPIGVDKEGNAISLVDVIEAESRDMSDYRFETLQLHVGQEEADPATDSRAVPIYQTTSYVFKNSAHAAARFGLADAGNIYGRLTNSTQEVLEKRLAALEGGVAALAVASGAAAITYAILALAPDGGHVVSQKTIYGGSYNLMEHTLPHYGVTATFVDAHDLAEVENAIQDNTRAIYLETLGNPNSDIPDIDAIAAIAHRHGLPLVIDNTFGTPYLIRPIEHGADIVVHSATKFIGGHGTTLGGIIVDSGKFDWKASGKYPAIADANPSYHGVSFVEAAGPAAFATYVRAILLRDTGAAISPFNAFLLLQGVETLSLRLERHAENTKKVVDYLASHPLVERVNHPSLPNHPDHALYEKYFPNGGASIFTFDIKGSQQEAYAFIDHLKIFSLLANVADVKSLVIHPATTTHSQLTAEELKDQGIHPGTIRLSIGTEHIDDILADLELGFAAVRNLP